MVKNNAIFAKKRMIVHQIYVKNGRFGEVSDICLVNQFPCAFLCCAFFLTFEGIFCSNFEGIFCCTFEGTELVRFAHEPTSKVRSHNAGHTTARSQYFQKNR